MKLDVHNMILKIKVLIQHIRTLKKELLLLQCEIVPMKIDEPDFNVLFLE